MNGEVPQGIGHVWRVTDCTGRSRKSARTSGGRRDVRGGPARARRHLEGDGMFGYVPQGRMDVWRATGCSGMTRKSAGMSGV